MPAVSVLWFRRDLRLRDHPALLAAAEQGTVSPLFVLDPALHRPGSRRSERLLASLRALDDELGGALVVRSGRPDAVVPALAAEIGASRVHVTRETTPYGRRRDDRVRRALSGVGVELVETGTPYAVGPGRILTGSGTPYKVFTPFARAWRDHGWPAPATAPQSAAGRAAPRWLTGPASEGVPSADRALGGIGSPAGEAAAHAHWQEFLATDLVDYATARDRPDLDATSRMSAHLKYGEIHPRTMLADLASSPHRQTESARRFVTELAWREFYADVLWHHPRSAWHDHRDALAGMAYDTGPETDRLVQLWREGRTGYPMVDAGMRQLAAEGFMHNRLRMITASFLTKDLHVWWPVGARHFLDELADGDLASNNHGWQWVAGTGTDAAPYFRVFNPVTQGLSLDPDGAYVRRWVPELDHLPGAAAHTPWEAADGYARGYPSRCVDHAEERREALDRLSRLRGT